VREWRVFDNTSLDYALVVEDRPALYVEAKGVTKKLDDKQFVAQTVNYANNDGVVWCVLTNGLTYRVYKTNEPVAMDQKLLFEVDLAEIAAGSAADAAKSLQLLSRQSLIEGRSTSGASAFSPIPESARLCPGSRLVPRRDSSRPSRRRWGPPRCHPTAFERASRGSSTASSARLGTRHRRRLNRQSRLVRIRLVPSGVVRSFGGCRGPRIF